jgi:hypothetical protein
MPTREDYRQILREELLRAKSEEAEAGDLGGEGDGTNVQAEERSS